MVIHERFIEFERLRRLAATAVAAGATRTSLGVVEWDISGYCTDPQSFELFERGRLTSGQQVPLCVRMTARCRKCEWCLEERRKLWAARALSEWQLSTRTWSGALTLRPDAHLHAVSIARHERALQGEDFESYSYPEQFRYRCRVIGREITKYLKRVRKESNAPLRYLLVAEAHKSGLPHWHLLIHEQSIDSPCPERTLRKQWHLGHSKWKLVHTRRGATYLCKYLSKSMLARVRASMHYGRTT